MSELGEGKGISYQLLPLGSCLSCAGFIIVSEQCAGVCLCAVYACVFFVVCLWICLLIHLVSIY